MVIGLAAKGAGEYMGRGYLIVVCSRPACVWWRFKAARERVRLSKVV